MRIRPVVVASPLLAVLLLTGCDGIPGADPTTAPPETPAELVLPEDAVLGLVAIATAPNGATADVALVVHASLPYLVPEAADAMATTVAWCVGDVDEAVISGRGFSFTAVDVAVTPRGGDWPDDARIAILPQPNFRVGSSLAADGIPQVEASDDETLGGVVPPCRQPAVLDGAGRGTVYLGIPQDIVGIDGADPFTAWTRHAFGVTAILPGDLGDSGVVFSACTAALTPLGEEFGVDPADWAETTEPSVCSVGAAT